MNAFATLTPSGPPPESQAPADIADAAALFSSSYAQARQRFRDAACRRDLVVESTVLDLAGADGEELAIDVVRDGPADAARLLIVISGVHGVEGYCGSAVQTGLLELGPPESAAGKRVRDTAVLYIHAVNPWGFSHSRRVTQENVDLNRNCIDFDAPLPVNAAYGEIHDLLLPETWPPTPADAAALAAYAERVGPKGMQRAVSLGQYTYADGMFFGGQAPTWSNRALRAILRRHGRECRQIGSIDIHTGLGPYGHGERIFASPDQDANILERAQRWWGELTSVHTGTSSSVPMTGPVQFAQFDECPQAQHTNICLEFGTWPAEQVQQALRAEHWSWRRGADANRTAAARAALKAAFYPDAADWKAAIWRQGREAFVQALIGLQRVPV
ncbi:M14 family metallopeptidase [Variovorax sp. J22R187]|uniref:M14 family metallopeptidase n=1 Tax=Variovorax saccharolyticus TaxID=3053516 RepID=UPI00257717FB|nr:M14 family metallopeptidase [Variovorax sp. J22R187]MDM0018986.1 M14 family metallopeptidase [Variovorax sp. J22R187]